MILFDINDVCKATTKNRLEVYGLLNSGKMKYLIAEDGKRKIEQQELLRVFPNASLDKINQSPHSERKLFQPRNQENLPNENQTNAIQTLKEMQDLRGMVSDLKTQIDNVLADNRRLLRLLDFQVQQQKTKEIQNETEKPRATDMAKDGWQQYQKNRTDSVETVDDNVPPVSAITEKITPESKIDQPKYASKTQAESPSVGTMLKRFFFKN